ncbi:MAG: hypothetical protein IT424_12200 [Pirellulales bacterium]|nr:hypothetical protein [Pirellulales bacterium]
MPTRSKGRCVMLVALASPLFAATIGCDEAQPPRVAVYPVRGRITFKGQPALGALVALHPQAGPREDVPTPRASVGKDGSFTLTTFVGGDGAPAGNYVLTVKWYKPVKNGPDVVAGPNVIPRKYAHPHTSDKIITIAAGENDLKIILL